MRKLLCCAALLLLVSCGTPPEGEPPVPDVPMRSSDVAGVPVPATAEPVHLDPIDWGENDGYRVPAMTYPELVAWYGRHLPDDQDFGGEWRRCPAAPYERGEKFVQRTYGHRKEKMLLVVGILDDVSPSVLITLDKRDNC